MVKRVFAAEVSLWIKQLSNVLHQANAWWFAPLLWGTLFSRGRRTVACWPGTGEHGDDYQGHYNFLGRLRRNVNSLTGALLRLAVHVINPGERLLFAIDDTPTKRYGPHVEGAGIHHNPTPGQPSMYIKKTCYKTFVATYKPAGGSIRVVLLREEDRTWRGFCCTDPNATVAEILEAVADRSAIEQDFHDIKEIHGTGQPQLRSYCGEHRGSPSDLVAAYADRSMGLAQAEEGFGGP